MTDRAGYLNQTALALSAGVAMILVTVKLWAYGTTNALSVAAALADSALDLMMALGGLAAVIYARRPPDEDHAFGHSSVEDLAALGQSAFIAISAAVICIAAILGLIGYIPSRVTDETAGVVAMTVSIALTIVLVTIQTRIAARTGSRVVLADRLHYLGDLLPNLGAIAALAFSARFGYAQLDQIVALGTAAILLLGAVRIGGGAWNALMDRSADPDMVAGITRIAQGWSGIEGFHDLKTRTAGSRVFVNIHVEIRGDLTLREAHDIGDGLRRAIQIEYPQTEIITHHDPV